MIPTDEFFNLYYNTDGISMPFLDKLFKKKYPVTNASSNGSSKTDNRSSGSSASSGGSSAIDRWSRNNKGVSPIADKYLSLVKGGWDISGSDSVAVS